MHAQVLIYEMSNLLSRLVSVKFFHLLGTTGKFCLTSFVVRQINSKRCFTAKKSLFVHFIFFQRENLMIITTTSMILQLLSYMDES